MSHTDDEPRSLPGAGKPTLEALLRLKRAERPDAAFWEEFDRGLREKQLAAIIEPKPWWLGLSLFARRLAPVGLPVSAGAAALFAVLMLRSHAPLGADFDAPEAGPVVASARVDQSRHETVDTPAIAGKSVADVGAIVSGAPDRLSVATTDAASSVIELSPASEAVASAALEPPVERASSSESVASPLEQGELPVVAALLEIPRKEASRPTPSQVAIAHNLAVIREEEPALLAAVSTAVSDLADATTDVSEPVLKMEVRNPRHARVLLAMADNPITEGAGTITSLRDRSVHGLAHDRVLGSSNGRLGVGGDRFSLSF